MALLVIHEGNKAYAFKSYLGHVHGSIAIESVLIAYQEPWFLIWAYCPIQVQFECNLWVKEMELYKKERTRIREKTRKIFVYTEYSNIPAFYPFWCWLYEVIVIGRHWSRTNNKCKNNCKLRVIYLFVWWVMNNSTDLGILETFN